MPMPLPRHRLIELWRYYQMGVLNTAFGLGAYALLVWLGLNMFVAQLVSHLLGMFSVTPPRPNCASFSPTALIICWGWARLPPCRR